MTKTSKTNAGLLLALTVALMPQMASGMGQLEGSEWGFKGQDKVFVRFEADHKVSGTTAAIGFLASTGLAKRVH